MTHKNNDLSHKTLEWIRLSSGRVALRPFRGAGYSWPRYHMIMVNCDVPNSVLKSMYDVENPATLR